MNISWHKISTSDGNATHIPIALKKLSSELKIKREEGYWEIENYAVCQTDLYETAYYIINPLLNLLEDKLFKGKNEALNLLYEISRGSTPEKIIIENNEISLQLACKSVLMKNLERIRKIYVYSNGDMDLLNDLIENIEDLKKDKINTYE